MQQRLLLCHLQDDTEYALDTYLACVSTASFISACGAGICGLGVSYHTQPEHAGGSCTDSYMITHQESSLCSQGQFWQHTLDTECSPIQDNIHIPRTIPAGNAALCWITLQSMRWFISVKSIFGWAAHLVSTLMLIWQVSKMDHASMVHYGPAI